MIRVVMTLPKNLLNEFDVCLKQKKFHSRSKGLQDVMREYIDKNK